MGSPDRGRIAAVKKAALATIIALSSAAVFWILSEQSVSLRLALKQQPSLLAAGDIAGCAWPWDLATASLLQQTRGVVLALGDNAYPAGRRQDFARCYAATWGRVLARTRAVPGNHEYRTEQGLPYYEYFGARAGERGKGYYSFNLDGWHIVALNSEIAVDDSSAQLRWLRADLAANPTRCALAFWHHPRFSSGKHGNQARMDAAFKTLYAAGAEIVLSGHDHLYERFAPLDPAGVVDSLRGVRQFVVGTGGAPLYRWGMIQAGSESRANTLHGVLALYLDSAGYRWQFLATRRTRFNDEGHAACH